MYKMKLATLAITPSQAQPDEQIWLGSFASSHEKQEMLQQLKGIYSTGEITKNIESNADAYLVILENNLLITFASYYNKLRLSNEGKETRDIFQITLSKSFLEENVKMEITHELLFEGRSLVKAISQEAFIEFEQLFLQIQKEYQSNSIFRNQLIANLFIVLLFKFKDCVWLSSGPPTVGSRKSQIVENFRRALEGHYRNLTSGTVTQVFRLQEYADAQNLHPNYLNNVIKSNTGKSIGTWIIEKTITEAESLLENTSMSIKEIGYRLGFSESAHFSNYFKKYTGVQPISYRRGIKTN